MKMKRTKQTTEIVVEREEITVVRLTHKRIDAWCPVCAAETRMVTPEQAAVITHLSARTIYCRVEAGQAHFTETPVGSLLVCLKSLATTSAE